MQQDRGDYACRHAWPAFLAGRTIRGRTCWRSSRLLETDVEIAVRKLAEKGQDIDNYASITTNKIKNLRNEPFAQKGAR